MSTRDDVLRFMSQPSTQAFRSGPQVVYNPGTNLPPILPGPGPIGRFPPGGLGGLVDIGIDLYRRFQGQNGSTGPIPGPGTVQCPPGSSPGPGGFCTNPITGTVGRNGGSGQPTVACPGGYHLNKQGYWTAQGYVAKGTKWIKNRRMNPLNPRAARRAVRRLRGTAAFARAMGFKGNIEIKPTSRRTRRIV